MVNFRLSSFIDVTLFLRVFGILFFARSFVIESLTLMSSWSSSEYHDSSHKLVRRSVPSLFVVRNRSKDLLGVK